MRTVLVATVLFALPPAVPAAEPTDEEAVRAAFAAYRTAILAHAGEDAAAEVTASSLAMYQRYADRARTATKAEVEKLPLMDRFQVIYFRHRVPREQLLKTTGEALFVHAVSRNWVGEGGVQKTSLGAIAVDGAKATGRVLSAGKPTPLTFVFAKENGAWKLDLEPLTKVAASSFALVAKQRELDENAFIVLMTEMASGERVSPVVWLPLEKKDG
jgi:hypothetical protein